jgi:methionyl-tRNA synthetase
MQPLYLCGSSRLANRIIEGITHRQAMSQTAFVSTAIPYVNARPHVGFALEIVQADAIARYLRLMGYDTFFLAGTDENSLKNVRAAAELGITTQELCDQNSAVFQALIPALNISNSDFIRTSREPRHRHGAQKFWLRTRPGDIYKQHYSGLYCVGCEDFYTEKEAPNGVCPEHEMPLEKVEEENYFFRLSAYQEQIISLIETEQLRIAPATRKNEMLAFAKAGLKDFSISRSAERAGNWGIPVPGDPGQVMYVWYDALTNYITALDYADDGERLRKYWIECNNRIHVIGKGINRFHTLYWPAMLFSAGLPIPHEVFVHGYLTVNGQKISKSLGNVIDPLAQAAKHGVDSFRYYLLRGMSPFEDSDYSEERLIAFYNTDLANNFGNLVRRVETVAETAGYMISASEVPEAPSGFHDAMKDFRFHDALSALWSVMTVLNQRIDRAKPWEMQKQGKDQQLREFLDETVKELRSIAYWLEPFMPATAQTLCERFRGNFLKRNAPLFPRLK